MKIREINGYIVRATTQPEEAGAPFYEPAYRFRPAGQPEGSAQEHVLPWYATSQNVESSTQAQAQAIAEHQLELIEEVHWSGTHWDLRFD